MANGKPFTDYLNHLIWAWQEPSGGNEHYVGIIKDYGNFNDIPVNGIPSNIQWNDITTVCELAKGKKILIVRSALL